LALSASHKHKENDMGQFKPMVKMETTEPSVELKLKKGGSVKKADGGMMGAPPAMPSAMPPSMPPSMPPRGGSMGAKSPLAPSLAARRRAMKMMGSGPAAPVGMAASRMKEGGKADMGQDKAMIKKAFKQHDMQEHKGGKGTSLKLKHGGKMATGGVVNGQGGFKTGGVVKGQGGFATGGVAKSNGGGYKEGGMTMVEKGGKMVPDFAADGKGKMKHGGKAMMDGGMVGNSMAGNGMMDDGMMNNSMYKKGGSAKKAYAAGGTVNSGRPVAMPQGAKKPSQPVKTNLVAGTFKDGGKVDLSKGAYDETINEPPMGMGFAKKAHGFMDSLFGGKKEAGAGRGFVNPKSVTKSKESVTVAPMKKGGSAC